MSPLTKLTPSLSGETMLELREIAQREENRQARSLKEVSLDSRECLGGTASRAHPGSWLNTSVGLGLRGPIDPAAIDQLATWYIEKGIEPRVELCPFADASLAGALAERGFVPRIFENVFFMEISSRSPIMPAHQADRSIVIRKIDAADEAEVRQYAITVGKGFHSSGAAPSEETIAATVRVLHHPRTVAFGAWRGAELIGGGAMELIDDQCALFGMSTDISHRRRGVQGAVIAARLNYAAANGATLATIGAMPGIATERNVRRLGFQLAYTKVHLVKPGRGNDGRVLASVTD
jgi:hypothetical protein